MTQSLSQYSQAKPAKGTDLTLKGYGPVAAETVGQPMTFCRHRHRFLHILDLIYESLLTEIYATMT